MPLSSGVVSMDNPEYILQEAKRRGGGAKTQGWFAWQNVLQTYKMLSG